MLRGALVPLKNISPNAGVKDLGRATISVPSDLNPTLNETAVKEPLIPDLWTSAGLLFSLVFGMAKRRPRDPMKHAGELIQKLRSINPNVSCAALKYLPKVLEGKSQSQLVTLANQLSEVSEPGKVPSRVYEALADVVIRLEEPNKKFPYFRFLAQRAEDFTASEVLTRLSDQIPAEKLPSVIYELLSQIRPGSRMERVEHCCVHLQAMIPRLTGEALVAVAKECETCAAEFDKGPFYQDYRKVAAHFYREVIGFFSISQKLRLIVQAVREDNEEGISLQRTQFWIRQVPEKAFAEYASSHEDPLIKSVASYVIAGLPLESLEFWRRYQAAENREKFLKETRERTEAYRYGKKEVNVDGDGELLLAYAAMDNPSVRQDNFNQQPWSWNFFVKSMKDTQGQALPEPFLKEGFSFQVPLQVNAHAKLNKGLLRRTISNILQTVEIKEARKTLSQLVERPPKPIRAVIESWFSDYRPKKGTYSDGELIKILTKNSAHLVSLIQDVLPKIIQVNNPKDSDTSSYIARFLIILAFYSPRYEETRKALLEVGPQLQKEAVSGTHLETALSVTRNLLGDPLNETATSYGVKIPSQWLMLRKTLEAEASKIKEESPVLVTVEVVPTKCWTDQFFGYVGEDCTKQEADRIVQENFQMARLIVNRRWDGMIYLEKNHFREVGGSALTIEIAPRQRLKVAHDRLLLGIEEGFSELARRTQQFHSVQISTYENEQSNNVDMHAAIRRRGYEKIQLSPAQNSFYQSGTYYVLYQDRVWNEEEIETPSPQVQPPPPEINLNEPELFDLTIHDLGVTEETERLLRKEGIKYIKELGHYTYEALEIRFGHHVVKEIESKLQEKGHYLSSRPLEERLKMKLVYLELGPHLPLSVQDMEAYNIMKYSENQLEKRGFAPLEIKIIKRALRQINLYLGMKV